MAVFIYIVGYSLVNSRVEVKQVKRLNGLDVDFYLRKSRKDIEEEKKARNNNETYDTLARHRKQLLALAKRENHNIIKIHEEVVSGESIYERPQIQELIRRIESGVIEGVVVVDIDRLGRGDMLDQGILDRAFRYSGAKLITLTETYDPADESWELVFGIKSLVSRQELKAITRRLQGGRISSVTEGKSISKKPPYGYIRDENLKLHPDPDTAWVVKKMFEMMRDGQGRNAIAQELDRLGISPPDNRRKNWSPSTITAIIKNQVYLGHIIWGKFSYKKRGGDYSKRRTSPDEWTIKENAHDPIVSQDIFTAANSAHSGRWRPSTVETKSLSNPLAGLLKCDVCGYTMWLQPRKDRPNDLIRCPSLSCKGVQKGALINLVEARLLEVLELYIKEFEVKEGNHKPAVNTLNVHLKEKAILKKQQELVGLSEQKSNLHDLLERNIYTIDTFLERQQNLTNRSDKLEAEIRLMIEEIQMEKMREKNSNEYIPAVQKVLEAYKFTENIEQKNRLLKSILEKVTFLRKTDWTKKDQFQIQIYPKI